MGSFLVVVMPPVFNHHASFAQIEEQFPTETFVSEATVKAFDIAILPGAAWIDVDRLDLVIA